jgi:hypothetical protein
MQQPESSSQYSQAPATYYNYYLKFLFITCQFGLCITIVLGAFTQLRKTPITFAMSFGLSVLPSAHPSDRPWACSITSSHIKIFAAYDIWDFHEKSVDCIQILLKSAKNMGHFPSRPKYVVIVLLATLTFRNFASYIWDGRKITL